MSILLTPARIGSVEFKNRIVMPPMTTRTADDDGHVTEDTIAYYMARVAGGVGLITAEIASPVRDSRATGDAMRGGRGAGIWQHAEPAPQCAHGVPRRHFWVHRRLGGDEVTFGHIWPHEFWRGRLAGAIPRARTGWLRAGRGPAE